MGLDWIRFNTPPYSGGLRDQPILLLRTLKSLLNVHNALSNYRQAQSLPAEAQLKWYGANGDTMKLLEYIWSLDNGDG